MNNKVYSKTDTEPQSVIIERQSAPVCSVELIKRIINKCNNEVVLI